MKDILKKLMLALSFIAVVGLVGCDDDDDDNPSGTGGNSGDTCSVYTPKYATDSTLQGSIAGHLILDKYIMIDTNDDDIPEKVTVESYEVIGFLNIEPCATLEIKKGVRIEGKKGNRATIQTLRGSGNKKSGKIIATGTKDEPIVFTSAEPEGSRARGDIGGIVLNGLAKNNVPGGTRAGEGGAGSGGGNSDTDNSGTLKYVRVEWGGTVISEGNEINGMTFNSVGSGTTLEYLQAHFIADDGFEWFGGKVNAKYLLSTGVDDDNFDMDNGFSGNVQFAVCVQDPSVGNSGFENSHSDAASDDLPYTAPTCYNVTLVGGTADGKEDDGMLLKSNIAGTYKNMIIANFDDYAIFFKDDASADNFMVSGSSNADNLELGNIMVFCKGTTGANNTNASSILDPSTKHGSSTVAEIDAKLTANAVFAADPAWNYAYPTDPFTGTVADLVPPASNADITGKAVDTPAGFETAKYLGAFAPGGSNWMSGWTQWNKN